jgi:hypothetical protein
MEGVLKKGKQKLITDMLFHTTEICCSKLIKERYVRDGFKGKLRRRRRRRTWREGRRSKPSRTAGDAWIENERKRVSPKWEG